MNYQEELKKAEEALDAKMENFISSILKLGSAAAVTGVLNRGLIEGPWKEIKDRQTGQSRQLTSSQHPQSVLHFGIITYPRSEAGRISVGVRFPLAKYHGNPLLPYRTEIPSITVSPSRKIEQVVEDINRRVIGPYLPLLATVIENNKKEAERQARGEEIEKTLVRLRGKKATARNRERSPTTYGFFHNSNLKVKSEKLRVEGEIYAYSDPNEDRVKLQMETTPDMAAKILEFLKTV